MMPLLLSLKPRFADLVFMGEKTVELRRRIASIMTGREVFIYVSSPVRMIRGGFRVAEVWSSDPETVWGEVASRVGVAKAEYDAYYDGCGIAHALVLSDVWAHRAPVKIDGVRKALPGFHPPQSWRYARGRELEWLQRFKTSAASSVSDSLSPAGCIGGSSNACAVTPSVRLGNSLAFSSTCLEAS